MGLTKSEGVLLVLLAAGSGLPGAAYGQAPPSIVAPPPPIVAPPPLPSAPVPPGGYYPPPPSAQVPPGGYYPPRPPSAQVPPGGYNPPPPSAQVPPGGYYPPPPAVVVAPPPGGYYQQVPQSVSPPPEVQFRQRMRYAAISRGLRAGGGVLLAFGIFSLMAGGIVYGLSAGEAICMPPAKPCEPSRNASYGLLAAGGVATTGGITMIVIGTVYRFNAMFGQAGSPRGPGFALLPAERDGTIGTLTGIGGSF